MPQKEYKHHRTLIKYNILHNFAFYILTAACHKSNTSLSEFVSSFNMTIRGSYLKELKVVDCWFVGSLGFGQTHLFSNVLLEKMCCKMMLKKYHEPTVPHHITCFTFVLLQLPPIPTLDRHPVRFFTY